MINERYPNIEVRSKNELAKRISHKLLSVDQALTLTNDVLLNKDSYWRDHPKYSQPNKNKWVRDASMSPLGLLLKLINSKVLAPQDQLLPPIIFGGVKGQSHKSAALYLLGRKSNRTLLKLDFKGFYEQITQDKVEELFAKKAGCGASGATLLAKLCCVPRGSKVSPDTVFTIGRGFATSSRLAVWCNLDLFLRIAEVVAVELRGKDPRVAIYVDDIGISASNVSVEEMVKLNKKLHQLIQKPSTSINLQVNEDKTKIVYHTGETYDGEGEYLYSRGFEHLGLQLGRNRLYVGQVGRYKNISAKKKLANGGRVAKKSYRARMMYKRYIERLSDAPGDSVKQTS